MVGEDEVKTKSKGKSVAEAKVYKATQAMESLMVPLGDLTPDPNNARLHPERSLAALVAALSEFGYQKPVVADADGIILAGNGVYEAAKRLGWTHVPVLRTRLVGVEAAAFAIADNRSAEHSEWDVAKLAAQLSLLGDAAAAGFDEVDCAALTRSLEEAEEAGRLKAVPQSAQVEFRCPKCGKEWSVPR